MKLKSIKINKTIESLNLNRIRTYCEVDCDCPTCHLFREEAGKTKVKECYYCQNKWKDCGEYKGNVNQGKNKKTYTATWTLEPDSLHMYAGCFELDWGEVEPNCYKELKLSIGQEKI